MGQAKLRGSYKQRKLEAIERNKAIAEQKRMAKLERLAAMTPAERKAEHEQNIRLAELMGCFYNIVMPFKSTFR